jgi:transglutaminase-like putative cysteine protease
VPALVTISLASSVTISSTTVSCYFIYLLAATFVLAHHNYLQQLPAWPRRGLGRDLTPLLWSHLGIAIACCILAFSIGLNIVVPLAALVKQTSWADQAKKIAAVANSRRQTGLNLLASFTESNRFGIGFGDFGSENGTVVMKMTPSDNAPHYWAGRTYDQYSGDGWKSTRQSPPYALQTVMADDEDDRKFRLGPEALADLGMGREPPNAPTVQTTVEVTGNTDQFYYTGIPNAIDIKTQSNDTPDISADGRMNAGLAMRAGVVYTMVTELGHDPTMLKDRDRLLHAGTRYPEKIRGAYLPVYGNGITTRADMAYFQSAVREALRSLPASRRTPLEKTEAIEHWVAQRCTYSLTIDTMPQRTDHVRRFLETTRKGYCELYASAMVVLCRTAAIPARVVTGFAPGDYNGQNFNVRVRDKHAWVEVFFPGSGWVTFDPTSQTGVDRTTAHAETNAITWRDRVRAYVTLYKAPLTMLAMILGLLIYVFKTEFVDRRRTAAAALRRGMTGALAAERTAMAKRYGRLLQTVGWLGAARVAETPAEYAERIRERLAEEQMLSGVALSSGAVELLTRHFALARWGDDGSVRAVLDEMPAADAAFRPFAASLRLARLHSIARMFGLRPKRRPAAQSV